MAAVRGPDVSSYQGSPDWGRVHRAGFQFAACKATEGLTYTDPTFARNWQQIKANGMVRIAYHFAHADPGRDPRAEAQHFLNVVRDRGGWKNGDVPALDMEDGSLRGVALQRWVRAWCAEVQKHWRAGLIYAGAFWDDHDGGNPPKGWPLWTAGYVARPIIRRGFRAWFFWQFTNGVAGPQPHSVPGIGQCDISVFNGSPAALRAFAGGHSPNPGQRDLKNGDQGEDVVALQHDLNHRLAARGFHAIGTDGSYGPATEQAVHRVKFMLGFPRSQVKRLGVTKRAQEFIHDPKKRPAQYVQTAAKRKKD